MTVETETTDPVEVMAREVDAEAFKDSAWSHPSVGLGAAVHLRDFQEQRQAKARVRAQNIFAALRRAGFDVVRG